MGPPDRYEVDQAPAARVDHVLAEELLAKVDRVLAQPEQRDHLRNAVSLGERAAEAGDLVLGVSAGRRQQADLRPRRLSQLDDQVADGVVAHAAVEIVAAEGEDAARAHRGAYAAWRTRGTTSAGVSAPRYLVASLVSRTRLPRRSSL